MVTEKRFVIYEIYVFSKPITFNHLGIPEYGHRESMGFYRDYDTAYQAIKENRADIYEAGSYPAALLVKKEEGMYPIAEQLHYFIYNVGTRKYEEHEIPSLLKRWNLG